MEGNGSREGGPGDGHLCGLEAVVMDSGWMTAHTFQEWDDVTQLIGPGSVEERGSEDSHVSGPFLGRNIEGKDLDLTEPTSA